MPQVFVTRRGLLSLLSGSVVSACVPFGKSSPFWGTIAASAGRQPAAGISREYAESLPYASMLAWFDGNPKALLVLAEVGADRRFIWYSAERQVVATKGLFAIQLFGTAIELRNTLLGAGWSDSPLANVGRKLQRTLDLAVEGERVQVATTSRFKAGEIEGVEILGKSQRLRHVVEKVSARGRVQHTNEYWVDESTGRCWRSRQIAIPRLPRLNLEIVKYPTV